MARQTTRRRTWIGVGLVLGVAAIGAGAWGVQRWAPFADDPEAVAWPQNIQPLADFVEHTTGQQFVEPIAIEFIGEVQAYEARVGVATTEPTDADRADAAIEEGIGRALGLWKGEVSVLAVRDAYANAAPFPVTRLADERIIVVNAAGEVALLPALVRAELTLRLTQALDDQLFHTTERASEAATSQDYQVMLALALGHAIWVHDRYVEQLSDDDIDEYYTADDERWEEYSAGVIAEVPASYRAIRVVAQRLGPMFIEALSEEGRELVEHAFTNDLPAALDQVSLPAGKYLRRDRLEAVTAPPGPLAAEVELSNQMGPFGLYLLLSTGQPATDALTAADGWGNDRYTAYVLDGRVCVDVHVVADSRDDADRLENGFNAWARARPPAADALVARRGTDLYATACDPGADADQPVPTEEAIDHYLGRAQEIEWRSDYSGNPALAECVAVTLYASYLFDDESSDYWTAADGIEQDCLDAV